jgi:hypothetical protein
MAHGSNVIKLLARELAPGRLIQPGLVFVGKARSLPFSQVSSTLLTNIRLFMAVSYEFRNKLERRSQASLTRDV